jgi:NitT/TauT family transport system substrate-binding protein
MTEWPESEAAVRGAPSPAFPGSTAEDGSLSLIGFDRAQRARRSRNGRGQYAWGGWGALGALLLVLACGAPSRAPAAPSAAAGGVATASAGAGGAPAAGGAVAGAAPTALNRPAPLAPPITIRSGDSQSGTLAGLYIGIEKGYFAEEGIAVELVPLASLEPQIAALGTGQLDVGQGGFVPGLFNAVARGIALRIAATAAVHAPGRSQLLVARRDLLDSGELGDYATLRGKTISRPATLGIATIAIDQALRLGGVPDDDISYVNLSFPDTVAALSNRAVDLGYLSEPFATSAIELGFAGKWREMSDLVPNHAASLWVYSQRLILEQPEAGRRFMTALLRGVRDYEDAYAKHQGRAEVVDILTRYTPIKDPALYDRIVWIKLPTAGETNIEALREDVAWLATQGAVPRVPDLTMLVDTAFTDYAVQRLGPYR